MQNTYNASMNRAGLVGVEGPTNCGAVETTVMACLPNMVVMALLWLVGVEGPSR